MQAEEETTSSSEKRVVPSSKAMESISERLSKLETLYFPRALQSSAINSAQRKSLLLDLLSRDTREELLKKLRAWFYKSESYDAAGGGGDKVVGEESSTIDDHLLLCV
ncbi:hypothetical protein LguiA_034066 [Lonicera macranthoides]